ncbi:hypothetical protein [Pseudonocardia spinosispora]|uniref:hypothetical protein n=1 Tax=Pseudonocardia spinosispora TaxID=103441 RepID=UPI00068908AD|nr:hypothetical protein [Pseudonocardia spinosispora]
MTHNGSARAAARPPASPSAPARRLLATLALAALMSAGCSNAPAETPTPATTPNPELTAKLTELARCMRDNGVKDFPDPGADGSIQYQGDSPEFKAAGEKCHDILPGKGNG